MATRTIKGTLDTFSVSGGSEITYLGNTSASSTGGLLFRGFRINPTTTGDIKVEVLSSTGVISMEIFQEDAYTASSAPAGYLKYSNIAKNGKGKGVVGVTVTNAAKDYVVLLDFDEYSSVNYSIKVDVP